MYGNRAAKDGAIRLGCSAAIFDDSRQRLLLTRRTDDHRWCLPGGGIDAGEAVAEAIVREVKEETGLDVEVTRLLGVYSNPHCLVVYPDGNRYHLVAVNFEARVIGGELLAVTSETEAARFVDQVEYQTLDVIEVHIPRITDAFAFTGQTFVR